MKNRELAKIIFNHALLLFILYILQALIFPRLPVYGAKPLIIPVSVIAIGVFEGGAWGGFFGLAAGVLCDIACGSGVLFTVVLPLIGMLVGMLTEFVIIRSLYSFIFCALIALLVIAFMQTFSLLVFDRLELKLIARIAAAQTLYSLAFAIPLYYPAAILSRRKRL
jgi:hypothetical protein